MRTRIALGSDRNCVHRVGIGMSIVRRAIGYARWVGLVHSAGSESLLQVGAVEVSLVSVAFGSDRSFRKRNPDRRWY